MPTAILPKKASSDSGCQDLPETKLNVERVVFYVLGVTPLVLGRMSTAVRESLLLDKPCKPQHAPSLHEEFLSSLYADENPHAPTYLQYPAGAFKGAMVEVASELGCSRSTVMRLMRPTGTHVSLYGVPQLVVSWVRRGGQPPLRRVRGILPEWCCQLDVSYVKPDLGEEAVRNVLRIAGLSQGVGNYRRGRCSGHFGDFDLVAEDDARYQQIVRSGGRTAQMTAIERPERYETDAISLFV